MDFDDNPAMLENKGFNILVKNRNGKTLWAKELTVNLNADRNLFLSNVAQIFDVNQDGINEVLICHENFENQKNTTEEGRISCYDYLGNLIWKYQFKDSIKTANMKHSITYSPYIISVNKDDGKNFLYCIANNTPLYPGSIFKLLVKTGEKVNGQLWNSGHIVNAMLGDFDDNNIKEIVAIGLNNAFKSAVIFSVAISNIDGQMPTTYPYKFKNVHEAQLNHLVNVSPTDLTEYFNIKLSTLVGSSLHFDKGSKEFRFWIIEGSPTNSGTIHYRFTKDLKLVSISPGNDFEETREKLIKEGKLKGPNTNSNKYVKFLESKISYWENNKWVRIN